MSHLEINFFNNDEKVSNVFISIWQEIVPHGSNIEGHLKTKLEHRKKVCVVLQLSAPFSTLPSNTFKTA